MVARSVILLLLALAVSALEKTLEEKMDIRNNNKTYAVYVDLNDGVDVERPENWTNVTHPHINETVIEIKDKMCSMSRMPPKVPLPVLGFCYNSNPEACCILSQDEIIGKAFFQFQPRFCKNKY
jgi:hypothetical protein